MRQVLIYFLKAVLLKSLKTCTTPGHFTGYDSKNEVLSRILCVRTVIKREAQINVCLKN